MSQPVAALHAHCANPGNPVFSCVMKPPASSSSSSSSSFPLPWAKPQNTLYRTTSSDYGRRAPSFESSPCSYHPLSQSFSRHLGTCGMYRDTGFNTGLDHGRVCDCLILRNTI